MKHISLNKKREQKLTRQTGFQGQQGWPAHRSRLNVACGPGRMVETNDSSWRLGPWADCGPASGTVLGLAGAYRTHSLSSSRTERLARFANGSPDNHA